MIPKIIHLCWFSGEEYPVEIKVCLDSWKRRLPGYSIHLWTKEKAEAIDCDFIREALAAKKWAFAADAVRYYAVWKEGGIYLDSDVFLYKNFDDFMGYDGCATFCEKVKPQQKTFGLQAACFLGEKGNEFCQKMYLFYKNRSFRKKDGSLDETISPIIMAEVAQELGFVHEDKEQHLPGLHIFPTSYLSPSKSYRRRKEAIGVHRIYGSWRKRKRGRIIELQIKHWVHVIRYLLFKR